MAKTFSLGKVILDEGKDGQRFIEDLISFIRDILLYQESPSLISVESTGLKQEDFEEKRSQLEERVSVIQQGLSRCGINSAQLGTEEIVEVFYKVFNPGEVEGKIKLEV